MAALKNETKQSIPEFKSIQEEAEFWDTHDFTDFTDFSESVVLNGSQNIRSVFTVCIEGGDFDQLAQRA